MGSLSKPPGSGAVGLGLFLLATLTGLAALAPGVPCPSCAARSVPTPPLTNEPSIYFPEDRETGEPPAVDLPSRAQAVAPAPVAPAPCVRCGSSQRITLLNLWFYRRWEGKPISARAVRGLRTLTREEIWAQAGVRLGTPAYKGIREDVRSRLLRSGSFDHVQVEVLDYPDTPGRVKVLVVVVEKVP